QDGVNDRRQYTEHKIVGHDGAQGAGKGDMPQAPHIDVQCARQSEQEHAQVDQQPDGDRQRSHRRSEGDRRRGRPAHIDDVQIQPPLFHHVLRRRPQAFHQQIDHQVNSDKSDSDGQTGAKGLSRFHLQDQADEENENGQDDRRAQIQQNRDHIHPHSPSFVSLASISSKTLSFPAPVKIGTALTTFSWFTDGGTAVVEIIRSKSPPLVKRSDIFPCWTCASIPFSRRNSRTLWSTSVEVATPVPQMTITRFFTMVLPPETVDPLSPGCEGFAPPFPRKGAAPGPPGFAKAPRSAATAPAVPHSN